MKKKILLGLLCMTIFSFTGCAAKTTPATMEETVSDTIESISIEPVSEEMQSAENAETAVSSTVEEIQKTEQSLTEDEFSEVEPLPQEEEKIQAQLSIIAQNKDMWIMEPCCEADVDNYAITDLDHNGRCEIIIADYGGTGRYTYSRFFEVNESYDGLDECETDFEEGNSQPDIIKEMHKTYVDENKVYFYVMTDYLPIGGGEYYTGIQMISLENGKISTGYIASMMEQYDRDGNRISVECKADGRIITEDEYYNAADNYFSGSSKTVTCFGWYEVRELPEDTDAIVWELRKSFDVFRGSWE